jgi:hypothetical protein
MDKWQQAVDDALVNAGLDCTHELSDPKQELTRLIQWCIDMALDPLISKEAQALFERGRQEGLTSAKVE